MGGDNCRRIEAGLPNITGTAGGVLLGMPYTFIGAFTSFVEMNKPLTTQEGSVRRGINFDASGSNSIYGASTTVQPPAFALIPQVKY